MVQFEFFKNVSTRSLFFFSFILYIYLSIIFIYSISKKDCCSKPPSDFIKLSKLEQSSSSEPQQLSNSEPPKFSYFELQQSPPVNTKRLALVLPFVDSQVESRLLPQIKKWKEQKYSPCIDDIKINATIYFYHPGNFSSHQSSILAEWNSIRPYASCVATDIQFLYANLPKDILSVHPDGPCEQFFRMFDFLLGKCEVAYVMEPDNSPIRSGWLFKLYQESLQDFWVKGSVSRCNSKYGGLKSRKDVHINGNALYSISEEFQDFLRRVRTFYPPFQANEVGVAGCATGEAYENGHDHTIHQFLRHDSNYDYARTVLHKFQYTDVVLNLCEDSYDEDLLLNLSPNTFLVHSKAPFFSDVEQKIRQMYWDRLSYFPSKKKLSRLLDDYKKGWIKSEWFELLSEDICSQSSIDVKQPCIELCLGRNGKRFRSSMKDSHVCNKAKERMKLISEHPAGTTYIWSTDFHVSPVACSKKIFGELGAYVHAEVDFSNCIFYPEYCAKSLKILKFDNWRGFSLDPCPTIIRKRFYDEYKYDSEFWRIDLFICSHPAANCELYMPFNRSILVYATTRLEFGRNDEYIDWRQPYIDNRSPDRWKDWIDNLKRISSNPKNFIAANNLYDVHYIKYFTGIDAIYLPSWCGQEIYYDYTFSEDRGRPSDILIAPYRDNLDFPKFDNSRSWKHPILQGLKEALAFEHSKFRFFRLKHLYPNYEWSDILQHPAIIWIPYQVSTMSFFEIYRLNIPIFAPSLQLLCTWIRKYNIMWERMYGNPIRLPHNSWEAEPESPNSNRTLEYWIGKSDFYTFEHVQQFDSWNELLSLLSKCDFNSVSASMKKANERNFNEIKEKWKKIFAIATRDHHFNSDEKMPLMEYPDRALLPDSFEDAMLNLWNVDTISLDPPSKINTRCRDLEAGGLGDVVVDTVWELIDTLYYQILGRPADISAQRYKKLFETEPQNWNSHALTIALCSSHEYAGRSRLTNAPLCEKLCVSDINFRKVNKICKYQRHYVKVTK